MILFHPKRGRLNGLGSPRIPFFPASSPVNKTFQRARWGEREIRTGVYWITTHSEAKKGFQLLLQHFCMLVLHSVVTVER